MGNRARKRRSAVKAQLRQEGWYENEFGELQQRITKAEARRRLLNVKDWQRMRFNAEQEIINAMAERIKEEIDREILTELSQLSLGG